MSIDKANRDIDSKVFKEKEWMLHQISINEEQLSLLCGLRGKESFKTVFSLFLMCLSGFGLVFFVFIVIHPNGSLLINENIFQFSGVFCVFLGFAAYKSAISFYDHRTILKQISEYIYQQRKAIDQAKDSLYEKRVAFDGQ